MGGSPLMAALLPCRSLHEQQAGCPGPHQAPTRPALSNRSSLGRKPHVFYCVAVLWGELGERRGWFHWLQQFCY